MLGHLINGYSFHKVTIITPHSIRVICYTILLTSNMKRPASLLVISHSETDILESLVILVTSYNLITIDALACIFPNFRQSKVDFRAVKFSWECHKLFKFSKNSKSKIHFICTLTLNIKGIIILRVREN